MFFKENKRSQKKYGRRYGSFISSDFSQKTAHKSRLLRDSNSSNDNFYSERNMDYIQSDGADKLS
jgi:hypothetical protein